MLIARHDRLRGDHLHERGVGNVDVAVARNVAHLARSVVKRDEGEAVLVRVGLRRCSSVALDHKVLVLDTDKTLSFFFAVPFPSRIRIAQSVFTDGCDVAGNGDLVQRAAADESIFADLAELFGKGDVRE